MDLNDVWATWNEAVGVIRSHIMMETIPSIKINPTVTFIDLIEVLDLILNDVNVFKLPWKSNAFD